MQVWSLGQEDPLEEEMTTHSSILAWRIPWTEEPVGYSPKSYKEPDTTERLTISTNKDRELNWDLSCQSKDRVYSSSPVR